MTRWLLGVGLLALTGCEWVRLPDDGSTYDLDEDGWDSSVDCDDFNDNVHPLAHETCNGVDNNCSGSEDDAEGTSVWYLDADGDAFGSAVGWVTACDQPLGYVAFPLDCDDADSAISPAAVEDDCTEMRDLNCDGLPAAFDNDGDGWAACADCNDTDADVSPDAAERCNALDDDCNGLVDDGGLPTQTWWLDFDGDGWGRASTSLAACTRPDGYSAVDTDCDDTDAALHPDAAEACDGADNDCDALVDEPDRFGNDRWYTDADGDGHGDPAVWEASCTPIADTVSAGDDCDDADPARSPDAAERCDGVDQDCDGTVDEDPTDPRTWYRDADRDGWGSDLDVSLTCDPPVGYIGIEGDCNDAVFASHPDADERCNGTDDNCDGAVDERGAVDGESWFADLDGDGWGDDDDAVVSCDAVADRVDLGGDCDDADVAFHPGALEIDCLDPADYNCDGSAGRDDLDGDGWVACQDCDDADGDVRPDVAETCNDVDDDCNAAVDDDAADALTWFPDADGDGYGDAAEGLAACEEPAGYLADDRDCDDGDAAVSPAAEETCATAADDDCDGASNTGAVDCVAFYADADGDTYGDAAACLCAAEAPWTATVPGDCDDSDAAVNPDGTEVCGDGADNNCDAVAVGCGVAGDRSLADADGKLTGVAESDAFGTTVAACGDLDGDGLPDLLVGATGVDDSAFYVGAVYLLSGPLGETGTAADAGEQWLGGDALDYLGRAAAAGDFDGDGLTDLVLGAPYDDASATNAGGVYLFRGPPASAALSAADGVRLGTDLGDNAGIALAAIPDADLDGDAELAVGAYRETTESLGAGAVYVLDAAPTGTGALADAAALLVGDTASDYFGRALVGLSDLDGDGLGDLAVGAYADDTRVRDGGAVYLYLGPFSGRITTAAADATLYGASSGEGAGLTLAAGDIDADGHSDVVVGALTNDRAGTNAGAVYVAHGPLLGDSALGSDVTLFGDTAGDGAGLSLAVGDLDDDGHDDVAVAGEGASYGGGGAVWTVYGPLTGVLGLGAAEAITRAEDTNDSVGASLAIPGDLDGDGFLDLVIGAPDEDSAATNAGAVYVLAGGPGL